LKRITVLSLLASWLAFSAAVPAHAETPAVPVRNIFQSLHAEVAWKDPVIEVRRGADLMVLRVGSDVATKNGTAIRLSEPIRMAKGAAVIATVDVYPLAHNWSGLQNASDRLRVSGRTHTIAKGDTLWGVAKRYGVAVADVREWNHLHDDALYVGEKLYVEEPYIPHTVAPGDTLWRISREHHTTVHAIKTTNRLESDNIYVGQTLRVPVPEPMKAQPRDIVEKPPKFEDALFPFVNGTYQQFGDTWGESRSFGGERSHEGVDIMAEAGVPMFSATDGTVVSYGWLPYGGWRLSVKADNATTLYYAHLAGYAPGIYKGARVKKGQLIGYCGATGYGPVGTTGKFDPHLHFGMYDTSGGAWKPFNPYPYLKWWEQR